MLARLGMPSNISANELPLYWPLNLELPAWRSFLRNIELAPADFTTDFDGVMVADQRQHIGDLQLLAGENGWREPWVANPSITAGRHEQSQAVDASIVRHTRHAQIVGRKNVSVHRHAAAYVHMIEAKAGLIYCRRIEHVSEAERSPVGILVAVACAGVAAVGESR